MSFANASCSLRSQMASRVLQSYALHARRTHRRGLCSNALRVVFVRAYHIASQRKTLRSRRAHHCRE